MKNNLRAVWAIPVFCAIVLLFCSTVGWSATRQFIVVFDFPLSGVTNTQATAINSSGVVVGRYYSPDGHQHGFVLNNNSFTSITVANSTSNDAAWINSSGEIVGSYGSSDGRGHAYTLKGGTVTTIDFSQDPTVNTTGFGISDAGDVVGVGFIGSDFFHGQGYVFSQGQITVINFPNASGTFPTMLLDPKHIVGTYVDAGNVYHGFLFSSGVWTTIDAPNSTFTWITGINRQGHIVGFYDTPDGQQHAFILRNGKFSTIDIPGSTGATAIANGNDSEDNVVGFFSSSDGRIRSYFRLNPTGGQ